MKQYQHIALGGTFDHLHIGHKYIIDSAFKIGGKVTIGLVVDAWLENKILAQSMQTFEARQKMLFHYLESQRYASRATIIPLDDIYGITLTDESIDALVVATETKKNAVKINAARQKMKLKPLEIITFLMKKDESGEIIRSERIRLGDIDSYGKVYTNVFKNKRQIYLPNELRNDLKKPLGRIFTTITRSDVEKYNKVMLFSVGDIITSELLKMDIIPSVQIVDKRSQRKNITLDNIIIQPSSHKVANPSGGLTFEAAQAIRNARDQFLQSGEPQQIVVDGEEDLTALLAILFGPIGSVVLYGQTSLGVVAVTVSEEKKKEIMSTVEKFHLYKSLYSED